MKSSKIKTLNTNIGAGNTKYVETRDYNKVIEDLEILYPLVNQPFSGNIDLSRVYTGYETYTMSTSMVVRINPTRLTSGGAEIIFVGDGASTPTFPDCTISGSSDAYDNTLAARNKTIFYYDGTTVYYSHTVL
jgi:hypothetical protein